MGSAGVLDRSSDQEMLLHLTGRGSPGRGIADLLGGGIASGRPREKVK
jgi:hypothetical protein